MEKTNRKCTYPGCNKPVKKGNRFLCAIHEKTPDDSYIVQSIPFQSVNTNIGKS